MRGHYYYNIFEIQMESTQTKQAIYQEEQAADSILFKPTIL